MKICMLSELFFPYMLGGAERRYYEIARRLAKKHEVTVFSLNLQGMPKNENIEGINVLRFGAAHSLAGRNLAHLATFPPAILKSVTGDFDVIDANQGISSFSGFLSPLTKKPLVATFHDIYWNQWNEYFHFPLSSIGKTMEFLLSKARYTRIIAVSPQTELKLRCLGFNSGISVIPSGVDTEFISKIKARRKENAFIFVGRLVKYKNVDSLLRAFSLVQKEYPTARLKIVGSGPEERNLRELAKKLRINVHFAGFVSEEKKITEIKSATALINPSSVEGLGLILIEAMACGTPVIAKKLDTYFFCNSSNCILYTDERGLASAMIKMMDDRRIPKKLARNGYSTASKYSWDNVAMEIEKFYEGLQ